MKLRYAVPFTLLLLLGSSWLSGPFQYNLYFVLVGISAVWCAVDSWRISIQKYNTQLALPALAIGVLIVVVWPLAFPLYLRTRHRIRSGQIEQGPYKGGARALLWVGGIFTVLLGTAFVLTRGVQNSLMPVATGLYEAFGVPVNVGINQTRLIVTLPYGVEPDSTREQFEVDIASCAKKHYTGFVSSIEVRYSEVEQRGAVTTTRIYPGNWWGANELTAACPSPRDTFRVGPV